MAGLRLTVLGESEPHKIIRFLIPIRRDQKEKEKKIMDQIHMIGFMLCLLR